MLQRWYYNTLFLPAGGATGDSVLCDRARNCRHYLYNQQRIRASRLVDEGDALAGAGRAAEARRAYEMAHAAYPAHAEVALRYGQLLASEDGRQEEALHVLSAGLRETPESSDHHLLIGRIHRRLGNWMNATWAFAAALRVPSSQELVDEAMGALRELQAEHAKDGLRIEGL